MNDTLSSEIRKIGTWLNGPPATIGLFKTKRSETTPFRTGPLSTIDDVESVTAGWVNGYNALRLHSTLGDVPPDGCEAASTLTSKRQPTRCWTRIGVARNPGRFTVPWLDFLLPAGLAT